MRYDAPICMSSHVGLPRGGTVMCDFGAMQSSSREWLKISELRCCINPGTNTDTSAAPVSPYAASLGLIVEAAVKIGNHRMTSSLTLNRRVDFVPVHFWGPRLSERFESHRNRAINRIAMSTYTWVFPRPLYVPPGVSFGVEFRRPILSAQFDPDLSQQGASPSDFAADVAAVGLRLVKPPPKRTMDIPYLMTWIPDASTPVTNAVSGSTYLARIDSGDALENPFLEPLQLVRIQAAMVNSFVNQGASRTFAQDILGSNGVAGDDTRGVIKIKDADDNVITAGPTGLPSLGLLGTGYEPGGGGDELAGMHSVFGVNMNSVRISDTLKNRQHYKVTAGPGRLNGDSARFNENDFIPMVAIEGFREVPL